MFSFFRNPVVKERTPEEKRYYFLNVFCIFGGVLTLPNVFLYAFYDQYAVVGIMLVGVLLFFLSAFLNYKTYHLTARTIYSLAVLAIVFLVANNTQEPEISLFYIPVFCSFFMIYSFEERFFMYIYTLIIIVLYVIPIAFPAYAFNLIQYSSSLHTIIMIISFILSLVSVLNCLIQLISINNSSETSLKASTERIKALLDAMPDMMFRFNLEGIFLDFRVEASGMSDLILPPEKIVGSKLTDIFPREFSEKILMICREVVDTNVIRSIEYSMGGNLKKDFEARFVKSGPDEIIGIVRDISDKKRQLRELERAREEAENAVQSKSLFLSNMSHEMRTPLNSIIGFTDLLMKGNLTGETRDNLQIIRYSSENLLHMINDILDLAKIEAGKLPLEQTNFSIAKLMAQAIQMVKVKTEEKDLTLEYTIDERIPPYLIGDPVRISQIVLNLVSNAIKFTHEGSVTLNIEYVGKHRSAVLVRIIVQDTGIGIAKDKLQYIFENFTQADKDTTRKYGGTGLGLSITRQLVELMHGTLAVQSEEGRGSRFIIEIPFEPGQSPDEKEDTLTQIPFNLKGMKVLVADDNLFNQKLLKQLLERWEVESDMIGTGVDALVMLKRNHYDAILMDLHMPEMDGLESTRMIRNPSAYGLLDNKIYIIGISADAYLESKEKALESGMDAYLSKPFRQKDLYEILCRAYEVTHRNENSSIQPTIMSKNTSTFPSDPIQPDTRYFTDNISSDKAIVLDMLQLFLSTTQTGLKELNDAVEEMDKKKITLYAHKLKAGFTSIAYKGTVSVLLSLEKENTEMSEEEIRLRLGRVNSGYAQAKNAIDKMSA